jgi:serine/threonine-protein phosphatase 6 regulatory ankyrin repeat subunit B
MIDYKKLQRLNNALIHCTIAEQLKMVESLIQQGADINYKNHGLMTSLSYACESGYYDIVELLLKNGADINIYSNGTYSLHLAAVNNHIAIVELLLKNGADKNIKTYYEQTALDLANAVSYIDDKIIELLK